MTDRNVTIIHKNKADGTAPDTSNLQLGELAVETSTGTLYLKKDNGSEIIVDVTNGAVNNHVAASNPHPQYVTTLETPKTIVNWFTSKASTIDPTFLQATQFMDTGTEIVLTATGASTGVPALIGQWMRETPFVSEFTWYETNLTAEYTANCSNTNGSLYSEIWIRRADNTSETLVSTSALVPLFSDKQTYVFTMLLQGPIQVLPGDTSYTRVYAVKRAGGPDPIVSIYVGGNNRTRSVTQTAFTSFVPPIAPI